MIHNNKVYADDNEQFLKRTIIYAMGNNDSGGLYWDKELTKEILSTEVRDLFLDGVVIYDVPRGMWFIPITLSGSRLFALKTDGSIKYFDGTAPTEE